MAESVLRPAWPWILVATLLVVIFIGLIFEHSGETISAAGTEELSKDMITAAGLLLAFTGIIFTGMLAEVRFRSERATAGGDEVAQAKLETSSNFLRKSAFVSFVFFASALSIALGNLAASLQDPTYVFSMAQVFVVPSILAFGGIGFLILALAILAAH